MSIGGNGVALALGWNAEATGADGWRVPAEVAGALAGVAGDFCAATGMGPTRGAGASCEKFGRAGGWVGAGAVDGAAVEDARCAGAMAPPGAGGIVCRAGTMEVLKSALERLAPLRPAVAEPAVL